MLKNKRFFLAKDVDSFVSLSVPSTKAFLGDYYLKIADCNRHIELGFSVDKKGLTKLNKLLSLLRDIQADLESKLV